MKGYLLKDFYQMKRYIIYVLLMAIIEFILIISVNAVDVILVQVMILTLIPQFSNSNDGDWIYYTKLTKGNYKDMIIAKNIYFTMFVPIYFIFIFLSLLVKNKFLLNGGERETISNMIIAAFIISLIGVIFGMIYSFFVTAFSKVISTAMVIVVYVIASLSDLLFSSSNKILTYHDLIIYLNNRWIIVILIFITTVIITTFLQMIVLNKRKEFKPSKLKCYLK